MHMLSLLILRKLHDSAITTHRLIKMAKQSNNQCTLRMQCTGINGWTVDHALPLQHCGELNSAQSIPHPCARDAPVITHMCTVQANSVLQINLINLKSLWMHAGAQTSVHVDVSVLCPRAAWLHPRGWEEV